jgi:DNA repair photolyase
VLPQAETDWSKEVLIYRDVVKRLSKEIDEISPQTIYMGYYTDPYQPCEKQYQQTRKVLKLLLKKGFSVSILTKSNLVLRDLDILQEMDRAQVSVSVAFDDNNVRKLFEARTIETEARIDALREIKEAGVKTGALICPVIPYVTEISPLIDWLSSYTDRIWVYGLGVREPSDLYWKNVQGILKRHFPALKGNIEKIIFDKKNLYWKQLRQDIGDMQVDRHFDISIHF